MNRRFNYTGRKRIPRELVTIAVASDPPTHYRFDAQLALDSLGLPPDALVCIEAYRQSVNQRFDFGTVVAPGPRNGTRLTEFPDVGGVLFRVKVVGTGDRHGHLLAEADRLAPRAPGDDEGTRRSLLPVAADDLQGEVWRLEAGSGDPVLFIERTLGDPVAISRDPAFASLVYPAVLQLLLGQIAAADDYDPDEPSGWHAEWLRFAADMAPDQAPPPTGANAEVIASWTRAISRAFCRRHDLVQKLKSRWEMEER